MTRSAEERKAEEIAHGRRIASQAETVWLLDTPASQRRLEHLFRDLERFLGPAFSGRILELGCGAGTWTERLARLKAEVVAVDITDALLEKARSKFPPGRATFILGDCENVPLPDASVDCVCGRSILHHLEAPRALREIQRLLRPEGKLWFIEPNMLNPQIMLQKNIPILKKWAGDTPDETAFFRWPLQRLLRSAGFQDIRIEPVDFLHPNTPARWVSFADRLSRRLERIPLVREIAGSLVIRAKK